VKFLIAVYDTRSVSASVEEMAAITALNDELRTNNQLIMAVGLAHPSSGIVIDGRVGLTHARPSRDSDSVGSVPDNSGGEAEEFMSGFWILEVSSPHEGRELARRAATACSRRVELREIFD
jgi:hypothetical protein